MEITFKLCSEKDLEQLIKVSRETFISSFEKDNDPKDFKNYITHAFSKEVLLEQLRDKGSDFYFVHNQKNLLGYFKINEFGAQSELKESNGLELERIYVIERYQGSKIGLKILEKVFALAKQKSKTYIWLGVWEQNERAIKWYQKHKFKKFGTHPYLIGNDEQTDWLMRKEL
ncbi:GNAT family N-acetyltransferase [Croceitalea rosinachiae]|uniref:N-acetyltransferase n=1 Tax=Croceitalea rosinachiae TaxID=3075596 RepID=A0ABU3A7M4_9FLAO|nr:N-acetyltransferase [Croceitalea sp. F388]MDT0606174.1 N-acetyltransferase [Croceitalea sp. F388]